jgi:hypothetical protein
LQHGCFRESIVVTNEKSYRRFEPCSRLFGLGDGPKYTHDRFRNWLRTMIPLGEKPAEIHRKYLRQLATKEIRAVVSVVED